MMNGICRVATVAVVSLAWLTTGGCRTVASRPNTSTLDQFSQVDVVELKSGESITRIDDPAVIDRIRHIYASAKWKPYIATLPAKTQRISCMRDDTELFKLDYVGWLMEIEAYDSGRYAELSAADREWLDSLFGLE